MATDIVQGPIEMRDYDEITLVVDHFAVLPDGRTLDVPAGTKLIMANGGGGLGLKYEKGSATKAPEGAYPPSLEA
jgi:hypothetical protein